MSTKFIGFKRKKGNFTDKSTGEIVAYDNLDIYVITNGLSDITGYYPSEYRIKGSYSIKNVLGLKNNDGDLEIASVLSSMVNKEVVLSVLVVDDKPVVTGLMALTPPSSK